MTTSPSRVILVGCGRLGSAILEGWLKTGAVDPRDLAILTPSEKPAAEAARALGAQVNPPRESLAGARAVVLAVKPALWRVAVAELGFPAAGAAVVSVMAGVKAAAIAQALPGAAVVRVMPTTGVAAGRGVASLWAEDAGARETARALFAPMAQVVDLDDEALLDAATAVSGSGVAYVHAFIQALARAGVGVGLPEDKALALARGTLGSAAASLEEGDSLDDLIARVASPGGTTRAALEVLGRDGALDRLVAEAAAAAVNRARELGRDS